MGANSVETVHKTEFCILRRGGLADTASCDRLSARPECCELIEAHMDQWLGHGSRGVERYPNFDNNPFA